MGYKVLIFLSYSCYLDKNVHLFIAGSFHCIINVMVLESASF
jgi:hypothetical protein